MPTTATTLTSWTRALKKALDKAGCDSSALLREAGMDIRALDDPDARYPLAQTRKLWRLAVQATGDSALGLKVASEVSQTTFHALGYTLLASGTLKEAFERIVRYYRLATDVAAPRLLQQGGEYHFVMGLPERGELPADEAVDAFASLFVRSCRALAGSDFSPLRIEFRRAEPADRDSFERILRAPLVFKAPENKLVFERDSFERKLEGANPELARHNDAIVLRYLARFDRDNIVARVQAALIERLPQGEPAQEDIARALHLSLRSLQRKLAEEYTTYKDQLDGTRRELALSYLRDPQYRLSDITYLLGFADTSSFSRACRRWTGLPPSRYRATL